MTIDDLVFQPLAEIFKNKTLDPDELEAFMRSRKDVRPVRSWDTGYIFECYFKMVVRDFENNYFSRYDIKGEYNGPEGTFSLRTNDWGYVFVAKNNGETQTEIDGLYLYCGPEQIPVLFEMKYRTGSLRRRGKMEAIRIATGLEPIFCEVKTGDEPGYGSLLSEVGLLRQIVVPYSDGFLQLQSKFSRKPIRV